MCTTLGFIIVMFIAVAAVVLMTINGSEEFPERYQEECFMCKETSCSEECVYFKGGVK